MAISYINHNDFGWKADVCKLQKHHADYGAHCSKPEGLNLAQVSSGEVKEDKKSESSEKQALVVKPIDPEAKKALDKKPAKPKPKAPKFGDDSKEFKAALKKA